MIHTHKGQIYLKGNSVFIEVQFISKEFAFQSGCSVDISDATTTAEVKTLIETAVIGKLDIEFPTETFLAEDIVHSE